jgi:hypothetical protein
VRGVFPPVEFDEAAQESAGEDLESVDRFHAPMLSERTGIVLCNLYREHADIERTWPDLRSGSREKR